MENNKTVRAEKVSYFRHFGYQFKASLIKFEFLNLQFNCNSYFEELNLLLYLKLLHMPGVQMISKNKHLNEGVSEAVHTSDPSSSLQWNIYVQTISLCVTASLCRDWKASIQKTVQIVSISSNKRISEGRFVKCRLFSLRCRYSWWPPEGSRDTWREGLLPVLLHEALTKLNIYSFLQQRREQIMLFHDCKGVWCK